MTIEKYQPRRVLKVGAELGEHPIWSNGEQRLYWLDIENETINRFDPVGGLNESRKLPVAPGCYAFRAGGTIVLAAQDGFYNFSFADGACERVIPAQHDASAMRYNDGRTDRQGRFWVSTVTAPLDLEEVDQNGWYRLDASGVRHMIQANGITNGTAFSPDGKTMYRADTLKRQIFAYDYDTGPGTVSNERIFASVPFELGGPDGATIDSEGGYWVALAAPQDGTAETGGVARFAPDGTLDIYVRFPVPMVTMACFGGPDLSTLYVTTARLEKFMPGGVPQGAGDIYAFETDFRGMPETPFTVF